MRVTAARLTEHGQPLRVESVELPPPSTGEVLVRMAYAGVNPVDRYQAEGRVNPEGPVPRTLGAEGAGWIDGDHPLAGGRVLIHGHGLGGQRDGLWATAAIVPDHAIMALPDDIALETAAAMGIAGVTAWRCAIEKAVLTPDDRVLVLGASGGVGSMLVSIASSICATVWGHTGKEEKAGWIEARGAAHVVVGGAETVAEEASGFRPTVVFDPLGGEFSGASVSVLDNRGRLVIFGASAGAEGPVPLQLLYRKALTVYGYGGLIETDEAKTRWIREALEGVRSGQMEVAVDHVIALDDVNSAFRLLADREVRGKIVLGLSKG
jgi:NADPH2:quinone reductase